jgi:DNA replication and repair protein RecF
LLLLDEPLVHLDQAKRQALFAALTNGRLQAYLTGTDAEPFKPLRAAYYTVRDSRIDPA